MYCLKCESSDYRKNGVIKGVQRYKCKNCSYNFTVQQPSNKYSKEVKKKALQLYLEGLGFRAIGRVLGVSNVSILNWIRSFGEAVSALQTENKTIDVVELDEMHSFVGSKKTVVGYGLLLIDLGKNSSTSLLAIEAKIQQKNFGIK